MLSQIGHKHFSSFPVRNKGVIGFDTETYMITPTEPSPKLICLSLFRGDEPELYATADVSISDKFESLIEEAIDCGFVLAAHNLAFDLGVLLRAGVSLELLVLGIEKGVFYCTQIAEKLIRIATAGNLKNVSLDALCQKRLGVTLTESKKSQTRTSFDLFDGVPSSNWPEEYSHYAKMDAVFVYYIVQSQLTPLSVDGYPVVTDYGTIVDLQAQIKKALALQLMTMWGVAVDRDKVPELKATVDAMYYECIEFGQSLGFIKPNGSKNMLALRSIVRESYEDQGATVPLTPTGEVKTDDDTLRGSGNKELIKYRDLTESNALFTTFLPIIENPETKSVHTHFDSLLTTGRTSSRQPNLQNPPRKKGFRECFIPRPGKVFCSCDYNAIEMRTLAQILYDLVGEDSVMYDTFMQGLDPHLLFAASLTNNSYEYCLEHKKDPEIYNARQHAKLANFGFSGGMGVNTFIKHSRSHGVDFSVEEASRLKKTYMSLFPEMTRYFKLISISQDIDGYCTIQQPYSKRVRGKCTYTSAANTQFQGLSADGATIAMWMLMRKCYLDKDSVLYGCRPWLFIHDEFLVEGPEDTAHEWALELQNVMIQGMKVVTPNIPIQAEPALMRRWSKSATPTYRNGRLIPWEDL